MKKQTKKKYVARSGAPFKEKDAQIIGEEVERIKGSKGYISAKEVLDVASDKNSKLHKYFQWDNSKAAEEFRLQQARMIVNHIVEITVINNVKYPQRSFVSVNHKQQGKVYVTLACAKANSDYKKQLLSQMITTLENLTTTMRLFREQD